MSRTQLFTSLLLSCTLINSAWSLCDIIEEPPINEINCDGVALQRASTPPPWTSVFPNPKTVGLAVRGSLSTAVAVSASASSVSVGQVLAANLLAGKAQTTGDQWVDAVLHTQSGQSYLQFTHYQTVNGQNLALSTATSASFNGASVSSFDFSYHFDNGVLNVQAHTNVASGVPQLLGGLNVVNFGQVLPRMALRRGQDAGVIASGFTVTGWGEK